MAAVSINARAPKDLHAWLCVWVVCWLKAQLLHAQSAEELLDIAQGMNVWQAGQQVVASRIRERGGRLANELATHAIVAAACVPMV